MRLDFLNPQGPQILDHHGSLSLVLESGSWWPEPVSLLTTGAKCNECLRLVSHLALDLREQEGHGSPSQVIARDAGPDVCQGSV